MNSDVTVIPWLVIGIQSAVTYDDAMYENYYSKKFTLIKV